MEAPLVTILAADVRHEIAHKKIRLVKIKAI